MAEQPIDDRSRWVTIDGAWFRREISEGVRAFFSPFIGAAKGFWSAVVENTRRGL